VENKESNMGKKFLIAYDLDKPGQDYSRLIDALERLGAQRAQFSLWVLRRDYTAVQIRDYLRQFIDANDRLLVVALTGEAAWSNLMVGTNAFKQQLAA
jgi:CRISPR-associated endonuclease Cas2